MAGNLRALTLDEQKYFNTRFIIRALDDCIVVECKSINRKTLHDATKGFQLGTPVRKINITPDAIAIWKKKYIDKYSLIDVQNAINTLIVTFQNVNDTQIEEQLKRTKSKLNNLKKES